MKKRVISIFVMMSFMISLCTPISFASSYPKVRGNDTWLNKHWCIRAPYSASDGEVQILYFDGIGNHGDRRGSLNIGGYNTIYYVGKFNGRYYFNVCDSLGFVSRGLYSIKPGSGKFKRAARGINTASISKKGLISKRYVFAYSYMHDKDWFGKAYVFDLKKNRKLSLGEIYSKKKVGNKLYYVKKDGSNGKVSLKLYRTNGKRTKLVKTYTTEAAADYCVYDIKLTEKQLKYTYRGPADEVVTVSRKYR